MAQSNRSKVRADRTETEPTVAQTGGDGRKSVASKRVQLLQRLERKSGARLKDLEQAFGWQPHTVRAAISGLRKAGHDVRRESGETGAVYRVLTPRGSA